MALIVVILSTSILLYTLYTWRKLNDNKFLTPILFGVPVILISIWSSVNDNMLIYANLLLPLYFGIASWYHWKRYDNKLFMYGLILAVVAVIYRAYQLLNNFV